jgi:hypothetical protein
MAGAQAVSTLATVEEFGRRARRAGGDASDRTMDRKMGERGDEIDRFG